MMDDDKVKKVKLVAGLLIALVCVAGLSAFGLSWYESKPKAEFQCVEFYNQTGCELVGKLNADYLRGVCFNDCADATNLSSCVQSNLTCSRYIQVWVVKP